MRPSALLLAPLALLSITAMTAPASADIPPMPGNKRVPFGFMVKGLAAAPDRVLFAYPCGGSDGAPMAEHRKLDEGVVVSVGRRGGSCTIYAIAKPAYETWAKDYKPTHSSSDPALEALAGKAMKCTGAPTPSSDIPASDPRSAITQTLNVTTINATTCVLTAAADPAPPAATTSPSSPAPASTGAARSSGCAFAASRTGGGALALAALVCAGLLRRKRKKS